MVLKLILGGVGVIVFAILFGLFSAQKDKEDYRKEDTSYKARYYEADLYNGEEAA